MQKSDMNKNVLIAGGSGLIGRELSKLLTEKGYAVRWLSRTPKSSEQVSAFHWDLERGTLDESALADVHAIINLTGAGVADKRWTAARRKLIIESRVKSNLLLRDHIDRMANKPECYLSSAAIGFYGHRGEELLTEESLPGRKGFLMKVSTKWEEAIAKVAETGVRTVVFRIGLVLSDKGGALPKIVQPIRFFIAPYFGYGDQFYSWIHIRDMARMFLWALEKRGVSGTYNGVAPNPVTNLELTQAAVDHLNSHALLISTPEYMLRITLGEMADVVLTGARVSAGKAIDRGFEFEFGKIKEAFQDLYPSK